MRAVNLLPPDMAGASKASGDLGARPEATGGAGPFVVLGVLAACVAGVAGFVLTDNTVKQRKVDLAAAQAQQKALAGQADALRPYADFGTLANARVATVKDLASSRFDWEQVFRDLSRAIPADVTLKDITGDLNQSAGGGSGVRGSIASPAITLHGCAPGQTQVARLMARLRDIDGVTRVSLTKSDDATANATTDTGTDQAQDPLKARTSAPCGVGSRPQFEVIAFFQNTPPAEAASAIPAAGATAAATPTPTPAAGASSSASPTPTPTPGGSGTTTASTTTSSPGGATP